MASEYKPNLGVIEVTAAVTLDDDAYAGRTINLNSTTGRIITLPAATGSGATYTIFVGATVSSGSHVIRVAAGTNVMQGVLGIATDAAGVTCPTAADSDKRQIITELTLICKNEKSSGAAYDNSVS